jgi:hypothetical protein
MKANLAKIKMPPPRSASAGRGPKLEVDLADDGDEAEDPTAEGAEGTEGAGTMPAMAKRQAAREDGAAGLDHIPDDELLAELQKRGLAPDSAEGSPAEEAMESDAEAEEEGDAPAAAKFPMPKRPKY